MKLSPFVEQLCFVGQCIEQNGTECGRSPFIARELRVHMQKESKDIKKGEGVGKKSEKNRKKSGKNRTSRKKVRKCRKKLKMSGKARNIQKKSEILIEVY